MSHAQIKDGVVVNCIMASDEWVAENQGVDGFTYVKYVDVDGHPFSNPFPGCTYEEATNAFIPPVVDEADMQPLILPLPEDNDEIEVALSAILGF